MTRVGIISHDWAGPGYPGACLFHRCWQAAVEMIDHGYEVVLAREGAQHKDGSIWPRDGLGELAEVDVVVFHVWMHQDVIDLTLRAQAAGQVVIQDVDDWYWGLPNTNGSFYARHPKYNPTENWDHYKRAIRLADRVIVSTDYLAERMQGWNDDMIVVPNAINLARYQPEPVRDTRQPTVGYVGGTPWHSGDLETLKGVLGPFMEDHGLRFIHGGSVDARPTCFECGTGLHDLNVNVPECPVCHCDPRPKRASDQLGLPSSVPVEEREIVPVLQYPGIFQGMDIGIAPLSDRPFNHAKSACKLLEYSAAGVPWIASDVGPYTWPGGGLHARNAKEWRRHLEQLLDPAERELQQRCQLDAAGPWDISFRWQAWAEAWGCKVSDEVRT